MLTHRMLVLSLLTILSSSALKAQAGTQPPPKPATIGFVDLEKTILEHPRVKSALDEAKREVTDRMEALRQKELQRRTLIQDLDVLRKGSRQWLNVRKRIEIQEKTGKLEQDMIMVEYQFKIVKAMKGVYEEVQKVVAAVAAERGLDIVLNRASRPVGGKSRFEFLDRLAMRDVVFARSTLDITEAVLKRLR